MTVGNKLFEGGLVFTSMDGLETFNGVVFIMRKEYGGPFTQIKSIYSNWGQD